MNKEQGTTTRFQIRFVVCRWEGSLHELRRARGTGPGTSPEEHGDPARARPVRAGVTRRFSFKGRAFGLCPRSARGRPEVAGPTGDEENA